MKRLILAALIMMSLASQAMAESICGDIGQWRWSGLMGRWEQVGDFNSKGKGTMGRTGNRFTAQGFDYDVCRKYDTATNCQWAYNQANLEYYKTTTLDCNNVQSRWDNNYGATEFWFQQNQSVTVYGYMYTNGTDTPCGQYNIYGNISGDGVINIQYTNVSYPIPDYCLSNYTYYGLVYGPGSSGSWRNKLGSGSYAAYRRDPLPGCTVNCRVWTPIYDGLYSKKPWRK